MSSDTLLKYLSIIFLFLVLLASLVVVGFQLIEGQTPSPLITDILGAGIGFTLTSAGVSHGVNMLGRVSDMVNNINSTSTGGGTNEHSTPNN